MGYKDLFGETSNNVMQSHLIRFDSIRFDSTQLYVLCDSAVRRATDIRALAFCGGVH
jgi:hypothetical protein